MRPDWSVSVSQPMSRSTLSQRIAGALKAYIRDRGLQPGDRLPSEKELSEALVVSRNIVREGMRSLETLGFVEIRQGKGTFVRDFDPQAIADHLQFGLVDDDAQQLLYLLEARLVLELAVVELAALRASPSDIERLREIATEATRRGEAGQFVGAQDVAFHRQLLVASKNPALQRFGEVLNLFFRQVYTSVLGDTYLSIPIINPGLVEHHKMVEAIERHDVARAQQVLKKHLLRYIRRWHLNDGKLIDLSTARDFPFFAGLEAAPEKNRAVARQSRGLDRGDKK